MGMIGWVGEEGNSLLVYRSTCLIKRIPRSSASGWGGVKAVSDIFAE